LISIIDYGAGNIGSILNMFRKLGGEAKLVSTPQEILSSSKLILPGVGHFDHGMNTLIKSGIIPALNKAVLENNTPILGICLGAQLMTKSSEEGKIPGLGWFNAHVKSFKTELTSINEKIARGNETNSKQMNRFRVPHMGWNQVEFINACTLTEGLSDEARFYFVHSYYIKAEQDHEVILKTNYGFTFDSGLHRQNIYAVQFHPEKSHKFGLRLFKNFMKI